VDDQIIGHFIISTDEKHILALTVPLVDHIINNIEKGKGAIYTCSLSTELKRISLPKDTLEKVRGEMLSVVMDEDMDRAYVTNPAGDLIIENKISTSEHVKTHFIHGAGLAIWKHQLIMNQSTLGKDPKSDLQKMNLSSGKREALQSTLTEAFTSSHILII
jgi:hypothetical protein